MRFFRLQLIRPCEAERTHPISGNSKYGCTTVVSDRDSKFWKTLFKPLETNLAPSTAYHPQTDSQSEIVNRKLEDMIRAFANYKKNDWDEKLVDFDVAYNSAVNSARLSSPFFVYFGIYPRKNPIRRRSLENASAKTDVIRDTTRFVYGRIIEQNKKMADYANKSSNPHTFFVGDKVWLATEILPIGDENGIRKLHPKFCGPFEISEKINEVTSRLILSDSMKASRIYVTFHSSLLKPYVPDRKGLLLLSIFKAVSTNTK